MTDLTAAFGLKQLERFPGLIKRRSEIYRIYDDGLLKLGIDRLEHNGKDYQGNYHLYLMRTPRMTIEQRNNVIVKMAEHGIACNVHFKPLPMMTAYRNLGFDIKDFSESYKQFSNEITLPMHTLLINDEAEYVVKVLTGSLYR